MAACGVAAGDKKYVPNELQATKLKYLRSEAVLAKVGLEQAQQNFQAKLNARLPHLAFQPTHDARERLPPRHQLGQLELAAERLRHDFGCTVEENDIVGRRCRPAGGQRTAGNGDIAGADIHGTARNER